MYVMTPSDHMSQDVSYFSGPNTSGAAKQNGQNIDHKHVKTVCNIVTYTLFLAYLKATN